MPAPSKLAIATGSVTRLVKEEGTYRQEQTRQEARIESLQGNTDENAEYQMRQEHQSLEETKKMLPEINKRIADAVQKLETTLAQNKSDASPEEIEKAEKAINDGKALNLLVFANGV